MAKNIMESCYTMHKLCPCNSNEDYAACCGMYHDGHAKAASPEILMRSRYAAYALSNIAYIKNTMLGKPLQNFDILEAERWSKSVSWLSLNIIKSYFREIDRRFVEFIATYLERDLVKTIHEISEFQWIENDWYYIDGRQISTPSIKTSRNSPCPCGSSKKFKHCHAINYGNN